MAVQQARYLYLVEGDTEKKMIDVLKTEMKCIQAGKSRVFNIFQREITRSVLTGISTNTTVVLVFDTDLGNPNLDKFCLNIARLKESKNVKDIVFIPQCNNFESELVYATSIRKIIDFFPTETVEQFKTRFLSIKAQYLAAKLDHNNFDLKKMWSQLPDGKYSSIKNTSERIKIQK